FSSNRWDGRRHARLVSEDLALFPQRAHFTAQAAHLLLLVRGQAIRAATLVPRGLYDPVPDGVGRGLELAREPLGRLPDTRQLDEPVPELSCIWSTCPGHGDLLPSSEDRCPPNRGNSTSHRNRASQ